MATAMPRMASTTSMREEDKCVLVCMIWIVIFVKVWNYLVVLLVYVFCRRMRRAVHVAHENGGVS